jgi:ComF family protein
MTLTNSTSRSFKWSRKFLDAVLPPRCPVTGSIVGETVTVAPEYWSQLTFLQKPFCARCGTPFGHDGVEGMTCGSCMTIPPLYSRARAALKYDDASAKALLKFKHGDGTHLSPLLSKWLLQSGAELFEGADVLIPVPLHRWRLFKRRYNQAALLAQSLSVFTDIPVTTTVLKRTRRTESQGHKSKSQRLENIRNAFNVRGNVDGKNIILIDDVMTSGATATECAKVLLNAGAAQVDVLTVARVVSSG